CGQQDLCVVPAVNPVIPGDHPDPHVLRDLDPNGDPVFYLVHTVHNADDIPIYRSGDLIHWELMPDRAFGRARTPGHSLDVNGGHFCSVWAPHLNRIRSGLYLLGFSASRFPSAQEPCPAYAEDGGVYLASSSAPTGPYATVEHAWEPFPAGANKTSCPADVRQQIPRSVDYASPNCQNGYCHQVIRLDSDVFFDPLSGRWWLAYSWFTNSPPMVPWEETNHGEHLHITELDPDDPFAVLCDPDLPQIFAANPHDAATRALLASYCPRCAQMLSFTRSRYGEEFLRDGYSWGVTEGASLFRRGDWVYLLVSGSLWDSAYYHVYWVAAPDVAQLVYSNPDRLVGRYLIPSQQQAFGHGSAVLGPDGEHWYFVHHRLDSSACAGQGDCSRDVWVSPIEFEDRGDGLGQVYIRPRFPSETPEVEVVQP
ncbi:MAG: family 43 glycosylhydrolase, partial [Deltaproteobacteria bacterium]|nr:family 43 glycosylhydrolase [Deltaproteobacteria bacterium]